MGEPVISVDTQKKELVGDFKNPGREWHPQGRPEPVRIHDFAIRQPETPACDAIRAIGQWNTAWDPFYFRRSAPMSSSPSERAFTRESSQGRSNAERDHGGPATLCFDGRADPGGRTSEEITVTNFKNKF